MGHKPKKNRPPDHRDTGRLKETASGTADRRSSPGETLPPARKSLTHNAYTMAAVCGFLLLAVVLVFGQTVGHDFVNYDDDWYVYENPQVTGGLTARGNTALADTIRTRIKLYQAGSPYRETRPQASRN